MFPQQALIHFQEHVNLSIDKSNLQVFDKLKFD